MRYSLAECVTARRRHATHSFITSMSRRFAGEQLLMLVLGMLLGGAVCQSSADKLEVGMGRSESEWGGLQHNTHRKPECEFASGCDGGSRRTRLTQ